MYKKKKIKKKKELAFGIGTPLKGWTEHMHLQPCLDITLSSLCFYVGEGTHQITLIDQ